MRNKLWKNVCIASMAGMLLFGNHVEMVSMAANNVQNIEAKAKTKISTSNGVANFNKGTANIWIYGNAEQTLVGKEFEIYQLFDAENAAGGESIRYSFCPEYENALKTVVGKKLKKPAAEVTEYMVIDYMQTMNNNKVEGADTIQTEEGRYSDFRYFVEEVKDEIKAQNIQGDIIHVADEQSDHSINITGLPFGYYIVDEITKVQGTHNAASLCMVNTSNPDMDIYIKSDYPHISKKIQEDDNRETIGEEGWNDLGDFEIGQFVPYKFTSTIPNINGYDKYYFAWHDIMDPALTFRPETVTITIYDNGPRTAGYQLKPEEFEVHTNLDNGETFMVDIQDLKAIVDREFNKMNDLKENAYGQKIVLRYDAILNDQAANNPGRPGFENDVQLEFSNNPDSDGKGSTGKTPWDTTVCFTYKLNGLKTNNHSKVLAGAKFRLYSDETCTEEVYVKKANKGYILINRDSIGGNDHTGGTAPAEACEIVSDETGSFVIFGLDGGTYWLKEVEAPAGYRPIVDPIRIKVKPTMVAERNSYKKGDGATKLGLEALEYEAYVKQFLGGIFKEDTFILDSNIEDGSGNLAVVNHVGVKLPGTGSSMMLILMSLGVAFSIYALKKCEKES